MDDPWIERRFQEHHERLEKQPERLLRTPLEKLLWQTWRAAWRLSRAELERDTRELRVADWAVKPPPPIVSDSVRRAIEAATAGNGRGE